MENNNYLYPSKKKLLSTFFIVDILLFLIVYLTFGSKLSYFKEGADISGLITRDVIILVIYIALSALLLFILLKKNYYQITNSSLVHTRFNKEYVYDYNNILYIDEEYTNKHKTLLFYTNKGDSRFLILDKDEIILKTLKKKCKNLMTKEEYHTKFPNVKL